MIFCGDPDQIGPKGDLFIIKALIQYCLQGEKSFPKNSEITIEGIKIFQKLIKVNFTEQVRCTDPKHFTVIEKLKTHGDPKRIMVDKEIISYLKEHTLKKNDYEKDPTWLNAITLVTSNIERQSINYLSLLRYAKYHRKIIIKWKKNLVNKDAARLNEVIDQMYDLNPELWHYFCYDCPCILLDNINPIKGFANGSMGYLHSIVFPKV